MTNVPTGEFVVRVMGEKSSLRSSNNFFQRQSVTQFKASSLVITAQIGNEWEPGKTLSIPFTVRHIGSNKLLKIIARNDLEFVTEFPSTMSIESGSSGNGTINITAPTATLSGTEVTLTIEATTPDGGDFNYAVLRLTVVAPITDYTPPVCEIVSINANCTSNCSLSTWELTANITDGNGTGIMSLTVRQGLGNLNSSTVLMDRGVNVTLAHYRASCCSQEMELVAVDGAGNVGTCSKSLRPDVVPTSNSVLFTVTATNKTTTTLLSSTNATNTSAGHSLYVSLWVTVEAILLFHVLCF
ncbi:hypothetical protein E1301_Tti009174 [Triplophysa tibetana]|uniref:VWA7 Ig-like domain-containing protein n=1 Tax=Triplophysa tibetana TaxID=1572043 RepID=A0A5A9PJU8_9TELE|nr:hypothetical protein E1301_Tti009174 [Triplophysa tibetana]